MADQIDDLRGEIQRLGPWQFRFTINGVSTGGNFPLPNEPKWALFQSAFPTARTAMELGCCEGYNSFQLAERMDRVVSIEGREENSKRARFVQRWLDPAQKIQFEQGNL